MCVVAAGWVEDVTEEEAAGTDAPLPGACVAGAGRCELRVDDVGDTPIK